MSVTPTQSTLLEFAFINRNTFTFHHDGPIPWVFIQLLTRVPKLREDLDLKGKTILITGGNTGLGFEMARKVVRRGAKVVLGVRSISKGNTAKADLQKEVEGSDVTVEQVDMTDFESIKVFTERIGSTIKKLDVVIPNAGVYSTLFAQSKYGYDQHLQVGL